MGGGQRGACVGGITLGLDSGAQDTTRQGQKAQDRVVQEATWVESSWAGEPGENPAGGNRTRLFPESQYQTGSTAWKARWRLE